MLCYREKKVALPYLPLLTQYDCRLEPKHVYIIINSPCVKASSTANLPRFHSDHAVVFPLTDTRSTCCTDELPLGQTRSVLMKTGSTNKACAQCDLDQSIGQGRGPTSSRRNSACLQPSSLGVGEERRPPQSPQRDAAL